MHIDIAEVRTGEGRLYLLVAIDRTSKFAFVELREKATTTIAGDFLRHLIAAVPYKVHIVLTDNPVLSACRRQAVEGGIHFTDPKYPGSAIEEIKLAIARRRDVPRSQLRARLRRERGRPPPHQAEASMDQRPGRADSGMCRFAGGASSTTRFTRSVSPVAS